MPGPNVPREDEKSEYIHNSTCAGYRNWNRNTGMEIVAVGCMDTELWQ